MRSPEGRITTVTARGNCQVLAWGSQLLTLCDAQGPSEPLAEGVTVQAIYPQGAALPAPPRSLHSLIADREGRFLFAQSRLGEGANARSSRGRSNR